MRVRGKGKKTRCFLQYHTWVPCQCSGNWDDFLALFFSIFYFFFGTAALPPYNYSIISIGMGLHSFFFILFFFRSYFIFPNFLIFVPFSSFFPFLFFNFPSSLFRFFFFCFLIYYIPDFPFSDLFLSASFPVSFHGCLRSTIVPSCLPSPPHSFPSSIPIHFETFLVSTCLWKFIALRFSHGPGGFT